VLLFGLNDCGGIGPGNLKGTRGCGGGAFLTGVISSDCIEGAGGLVGADSDENGGGKEDLFRSREGCAVCSPLHLFSFADGGSP